MLTTMPDRQIKIHDCSLSVNYAKYLKQCNTAVNFCINLNSDDTIMVIILIMPSF